MLTAGLIVWISGLASADDSPRKPAAADARASTLADDEAAAMAFVGEHHPELAALLTQLKPMRPEEYRRGVRELAQVSRTLATIKERDPRRYRAQLDTWKARSRVDLLAARLASWGGPSPELQAQLHQAVAAQIDAEIQQQRVEREILTERLHKLDETIGRLESRRDSAVETRVQNLLRKARHSETRAARTVGAEAKRKNPPKTKPKTGDPARDAAPDAKVDPRPAGNVKPNEERTR